MKIDDYRIAKAEKAIKLFDYTTAIKFLNDYHKENPDEKLINLLYADIYLRYKIIDFAEYYLSLINQNNLEESKDLNRYVLLKIKLYLLKFKYNEVYSFYLKNKLNIIENTNNNTNNNTNGYYKAITANTLNFFLRCRSGNIDEEEMENVTSYIYKQIYKYDENATINNLIRFNNIENNTLNNNNFKFNDNIDFEQLYNDIKKSKKQCQTYYYSPIFVDRFYKYDNIGYDAEGNQLNYLKVMSLYDTDEIIYIQPTVDKSNLISYDITPKKGKIRSKKKIA